MRYVASCQSLANNVGTASRRIGGKEESASGCLLQVVVGGKKAEELLLREERTARVHENAVPCARSAASGGCKQYVKKITNNVTSR